MFSTKFSTSYRKIIFCLGHILPNRLLSPSLTFGTYDTLVYFSHKIFIQSRRGQLYANDAKIIDGDIMSLNGAVHVIDTVLFSDLNQTEPNPEPNLDPNHPELDTMTYEPTILDNSNNFRQRSEMRMKRAVSPKSKSHGKNCGNKPGPQPRHISSAVNEGPRFGSKKLAPLGRNSFGMRNKELMHAFEKLLG